MLIQTQVELCKKMGPLHKEFARLKKKNLDESVKKFLTHIKKLEK